MQPNRDADWQWSKGVDSVKLIEIEHGIQLDVEFQSPEEKTFLVSRAGKGRLTQPPDNTRSY